MKVLKRALVFMLLLVVIMGIIPVQCNIYAYDYDIDSGIGVRRDSYRLVHKNGASVYFDSTTQSRLEKGYNLAVAMLTESNAYVMYVITYPAGTNLGVWESGNNFLIPLDENNSVYSLSTDTVDFVYSAYRYEISNGTFTTISANNKFRYSTESQYNWGWQILVSRLTIVYSDVELYKMSFDSTQRDPIYTSGYLKTITGIYYSPSWYLLEEWCVDAGLNCSASSNESTSVIPFWYSDSYAYIVTKNQSSEYRLFMIYVGNPALYYLVTNAEMNQISVGSDSSGAETIAVREFKYDTDGWLLVQKQDINFTENTGVIYSWGSNETMMYTSHDLYGDNAEIVESKTEEYAGSGIAPTPTPIPTATPTPGSSSGNIDTNIGGNVQAGGAMDFIITMLAAVWNDLFSIEMDVDGYKISFQQIIIYGIIAYGVMWVIGKFVRKD